MLIYSPECVCPYKTTTLKWLMTPKEISRHFNVDPFGCVTQKGLWRWINFGCYKLLIYVTSLYKLYMHVSLVRQSVEILSHWRIFKTVPQSVVYDVDAALLHQGPRALPSQGQVKAWHIFGVKQFSEPMTYIIFIWTLRKKWNLKQNTMNCIHETAPTHSGVYM